MKLEPKHVLGIVGIASVTYLQTVAWFTGHNGAAFALTSAVIGGVVGTLVGFGYAKTKT